MRAGMGKVLAFEINLRAAECFSQPLRKIQRCRPAYICLLEMNEFFLKFPVLPRGIICLFELIERWYQRLRRKTSPVVSEVTFSVR